MDSCEWKHYTNEFTDIWDTACEHAFEFNSGTPSENEFIYCPYCGKPIRVDGYEITDDYESDSNDGDHPAMMEISIAEWERVQAQLAAARAALEKVITCHDGQDPHLWQGAWDRIKAQIHAALAAMEEKP